jgi:signal recognition particle subunit SEC65
MPKKHLFISDVQAKPGVNLDHLRYLGLYILDKRPDVIVCIGDFADMESLSSYDKGKLQFEGRRYKADLAVAKQAMDILLHPLRELQAKQKQTKHKVYKPRMIMCLGNHEERIQRVAAENPEFDGLLSYDDLPYQDWEVYDYLKPVFVDGVCYTHYLANPMSGRPYGGTAMNQLIKVGHSFVVGHKQVLDVATRFTLDGRQQWGIISGAFYSHEEAYKGPQGNDHWRGVVFLNDVHDGSFSPFFVSLDYLKRRYGNEDVL